MICADADRLLQSGRNWPGGFWRSKDNARVVSSGVRESRYPLIDGYRDRIGRNPVSDNLQLADA